MPFEGKNYAHKDWLKLVQTGSSTLIFLRSFILKTQRPRLLVQSFVVKSGPVSGLCLVLRLDFQPLLICYLYRHTGIYTLTITSGYTMFSFTKVANLLSHIILILCTEVTLEIATYNCSYITDKKSLKALIKQCKDMSEMINHKNISEKVKYGTTKVHKKL